MPAVRLAMSRVKEILRLRFELKLNHRDIALACGISPSTVGACLSRCARENLRWPLPEGLTDSELEGRVYRLEPCKEPERPVPDFAYVRKELARRDAHVSLNCLWEEYRKTHANGYEYSWFCREYKAWNSTVEPVMRQVHRAGEKIFVDYAGDTLSVVNPDTGEVLQAQIFIGVLGASNFAFAEATWSQELPNWIGSHIRMFEFFGGVSELLVPDNLRSGVSKACFFDPEINPTYAALARHYGVGVLPTRSRKPKDKAKVENAVLVVERWILAKLRDVTFYSLDDLNEAIDRLLTELNERPFQKLEGNRRQAFLDLDKPALKPLPAQQFELAIYKTAKVHIDYHIQVEGCFYSVPYQNVRRRVEVRLTQQIVEVLYDSRRIAVHKRAYKKGYVSTNPDHMPSHHREVHSWSPDLMVQRATRVGPNTLVAVRAIIDSKEHPEQAVRSCLGVLGLAGKHGSKRLEQACALAVERKVFAPGSIKSILKRNLQTTKKADTAPPASHENLRGQNHFAKAAASC